MSYETFLWGSPFFVTWEVTTMSEKLTQVLKIRITPGLDEALRAEADRLHLRVADLVRGTLAHAVSDRHINDPAVREVQREEG